MTTSTLSETETGVYVDGTGDTVFVFTDTDGENKSIILQEDPGKNFGRVAHTYDGYYEGNYAPYTPVRLFMPNIKRPDTPAYNIEEIERYGEHDGAWIGDQGTLIIHRSDGNPPDRILHVMFSYDTHHELELVRYGFSPISSSVAKTEKFRHIMDDERLTIVPATSNESNMPDHTPDTFHDRLDDIQKQIDNAREHADAAINAANTAINALMDAIHDIAKTLYKNTTTVITRDEPNSEGFWVDKDGDIWACDRSGNVRLIAKVHQTYDDHREIYDMSYNYGTYGMGPFTKIDNPFLKGEDHAD